MVFRLWYNKRPFAQRKLPFSAVLAYVAVFSAMRALPPLCSITVQMLYLYGGFCNYVRWYNQVHKHSGLKFVTPEQRHSGTATTILQYRDAVYAAAKRRNPERWSGQTRNWTSAKEVWLNPERTQMEKLKQAA
jgi:hypothetical protein